MFLVSYFIAFYIKKDLFIKNMSLHVIYNYFTLALFVVFNVTLNDIIGSFSLLLRMKLISVLIRIIKSNSKVGAMK